MLTVTYHGGQLLAHVEAQAVYLGSDWTASPAVSGQTKAIDQFMSYLVQSPYMDMLNQAGYNVGAGTATGGANLNLSINKSTGITDSQIRSDLQSAITSSQLAKPDANRLYVVYVEPGVVIKDGGATSANSFLGYHGAFAGKDALGKSVDIRYAVIAYPGSPNPSASSQGFTSSFNQLTDVTSHELAEAVTDPDVNYKALGWYDNRLNGEIGDLTSINTVLNGYVVQDVVSKSDQPIAPRGNSTGGNPGSTGGATVPTTLLTPPQNFTGAAISSTSAQLSWSGVTGAAGYRILLVNGSQTTQIGTVGAAATTATITGLTAGSTQSFKVEAYNGTTVADSAAVTIAMPEQQSLAAPVVTLAAVSANAASLSWNVVSGAQGYNIYYWNGVQAVLLGSLGASATSVRLTGLPSGATVHLLVEAYRGNMVADSPWVSVTMPSTSGTRWPWWRY